MAVRRIAFAFSVICAGVVTLIAQDGRPAPQFRFERPIQATTGPRRLRPDVPLLAGSQARLNDLRFYDSSGREVPYLLVPSTPPAAEWLNGSVSAIAATEKTSGFEADFGQLVTMDRVRLGGIPAPFMKRANVEGSGDRSRWTVLLDQTTIFDLPESELRQLELGFMPGAYRYVRITWDDTNSAKVPPPRNVMGRKVEAEHAPAPPVTTPLVFERRPSEPGKSRYRIGLPGARLPIVALELDVAGGYVLRRATVTESRLSGGQVVPVVAGTSMLRKVVEGDLAATAMRIPITASEPEIDLIIEDGDNPPLDLRGISAIFADLPWIYLEADERAIVARYGDAALQAPRYDLEAARSSVRIETVPDASWGDVREMQPAGARSSATAAMPTGGAPIDAAFFRYTRTLRDAETGLIAVPLDTAVLAHSAGPANSFADVRVIDANGRQVPYVLERRDEPLAIPLTLQPANAPQGTEKLQGSATTTYYRVRLPQVSLPPAKLVLTTSARVFDRSVHLSAERSADKWHRDAWQESISGSRWTHANRDIAAPALTLPLSPRDVQEVVIAVEEGDNTPLPLTSAELLLPSYRLRLFREGGAPLQVVYGRSDLRAPNYDLALLASQVLGVPAREVDLSPEQPGGAARRSGAVAMLVSPRVFWGVLIGAVLALLTLLAKLLKQETPLT